jgi:hypothetical protein
MTSLPERENLKVGGSWKWLRLTIIEKNGIRMNYG